MNSIAELLGGEYGNDRAFLSPGGMVQGTVTDNAESGEPGMVKVEFTAWKSGKNVCEWIPLLRPYAGKDYGSYLVPEVGDIVPVGFIGTDFRRPVVLGSLFPATAQMKSDSFEKKNTTRRFKTKGGVDLTLSDAQGKASVEAVTPGGLRLALDDGKQLMTLADKNGQNQLSIDCQKGEVSLEGKSKLTIKAGSCEITMDGMAGKLELKGGQLSIKADMQAELDGGQSLGLKGTMLKAEGTQVSVSGSAMTQVSGGMVKLG